MTDAAVSPASLPAAPSKRSWLPLIAVGVVLLLCLAMLAKITGSIERVGPRVPHRYVFQPDFAGKVRILYNVQGAPPLEEKDGHRIVEVPMSGMVETSTPFVYGTAPDQFHRRRADGTVEHLHGNYLKERKLGVIGDANEFFESPSETELWRQEMVRKGMIDAQGNPLLGGTTSTDAADMIHYELLILRDDI